jgi:hypothetical protein
MAVATYTTDLVNLNLVNVAGSTTNWTALGGGASGLVAETDFFIQGDGCLSKAGWSAATKGAIYNFGSSAPVPSGSAVFMWVYYWAPNALDTEALGGLQILIGSGTAAYKQYYVRGKDTYTYGGWICVPVEPSASANATTGTPTAALQYFGSQAKVLGAVTKGQPLGIDAFRYGRAIKVLNGQSPTSAYGNFYSASVTNDSGSNRWGLLQAIDGGYLQQGTFMMGSGSTSVDFRDENRTIVVANTKKVKAPFNRFEVRNASSNVDWTNINISALGTTAPGDFIVVDNAPVDFSRCSFTNMGFFRLRSNTTSTNTTYRNCKLITQSGSVFNGCSIIGTQDSTKQMLSNNPANISNTTFVSKGTGHALEINTAGSYAFVGNLFSGFGASGSTDATIYNTSGGQVTMSISDGDTPTYRNSPGSKTRIDSSITITLTGLVNPSEVRVYYAGTSNAVAGQEDVTSGTYAFAVGSGVSVDISILSLTYQILRIKSYSTTSSTTLPVQQQVDRQYNNP